MKLRMDKTLRFWVDVACDHIEPAHESITKRRLITHVLREYERRGHALRYLNQKGGIAWKPTPTFLARIADAERDAQDELDDD
jgi:hypothetical protein